MHLSIIIFFIWLTYMITVNQWYLFIYNWGMPLVMIAGSFIAGSTPESGGAFAFPVMSLAYNITPDVIRNFSLAIQSIGMTSASCFILKKKIPVDRAYLMLSTAGGAAGVVIGTLFLKNPGEPEYIKMLFFSFWLSFAFVLFYLNHVKKRAVNENLPALSGLQKFEMIIIGLCGGVLTSAIGSGIDILTFSYVTMRYSLSEKVATPTSVIIMAVNSIAGFTMRLLIHNDIGAEEFNLIKVCVPVVIFGAPLGVYFINRIKRTQIANFLYVIIVAQFLIAWAIIRPEGQLLFFSILVFIFGIIVFSFFGRIILFAAVLRKILVPERYMGRTFAWDINQTIGFDTGAGFLKNIVSHKNLAAALLILWTGAVIIFTGGDISVLFKSPVPFLIIAVAIFASTIANSTAADGGMIFLPALSLVFLEHLRTIDFARSYFSGQFYTLSEIIIAIQITQSFGMLSGGVSWWRSGVRLLIRENILNIAGVCIGVIIGKFYLKAEEEIIYRIFGSWNLVMFFVIVYNLVIVKNIPMRTKWPQSISWIFLPVGIAGGLMATWTSIGVGSLTSFVLILLLKPEISIANGSIMMAVSSMIIVVIDLVLNCSIPFEIILFTVPAVIIGGYSAPFFSLWLGRKFYRLAVRANPFIVFNSQGKKINKSILEYTSGQLVMSISFIIVCMYNAIYFLFIKPH